MSFLSRLFGPKPAKESGGKIEAQLERLEAEAKEALPGYVGSAYNKAGDLALKGGQSDRAVGYYGQAINAFLEDAQREAARGVANKIIRVHPNAIRTLCTLTWLDLAAQHQAMALLHLREYVAASKEADQHGRAATQIYAMARLSPDSQFVNAVADSLDSLDFTSRAQEVRGWGANGAPNATDDDDRLSDKCLEGAIHSNDRNEEFLKDDFEEGTGTDHAGAAGDETVDGSVDEAVEAIDASEATDDASDPMDDGDVEYDDDEQDEDDDEGEEVDNDEDAGDDEGDDDEVDGEGDDDEVDGDGDKVDPEVTADAGDGAHKSGRRSKKGRKRRKKRR